METAIQAMVDKILGRQNAETEYLVAAFLKQSGKSPADIEICTQNTGSEVRVWVREKEQRQPVNKQEMIWKQKYERLVSRLQDIEIEVRNEAYEVAPSRAFVQANRMYVSFHLDAVDSKEKADELWGEGNYDVFDLNKDLSPEDPENDGEIL